MSALPAGMRQTAANIWRRACQSTWFSWAAVILALVIFVVAVVSTRHATHGTAEARIQAAASNDFQRHMIVAFRECDRTIGHPKAECWQAIVTVATGERGEVGRQDAIDALARYRWWD